MSAGYPGSLWDAVEPLLLEVERPSRYLGREYNSPPVEPDDLRVVLCYPDVYEIGISNTGLLILQEVVNGIEGAACERAYSPWVDMEAQMRARGVPLFSLETHRPVGDSDILGIGLPHELTYTNVLNLIDMAGLPLAAQDRTSGPVVVGGGCGTSNPEPLADFFDLFVLGEGEEALSSLVRLALRARAEGRDREWMLGEASALPGVYRPSDYSVEYSDEGPIAQIESRAAGRPAVRKNVVDLDEWAYPRHPVIPFCEAIHDRVNVELFRGCTRGCRFCQAGMTCRPVRERSADRVLELVEALADDTGHDEVSLCSLSSTDYTLVEEVARKTAAACDSRGMTLSLPSLRMDTFSVELASRLDRGGRGGLTFAPEAGSERLRRVINKPISEREMVDALVHAVRSGRRRMKLYFMIGLPTETDDDIRGTGELVYRLRDAVRSEGLPPPAFNVSVSTFVPKSHTPFQWAAQIGRDEVERRQDILKGSLRSKGVNLSWHDSSMSHVEGLLARGDRRLAAVLRSVWSAGQRFDAWSELFDFSRWEEGFVNAAVDPGFYVERERPAGEVFPWDHLDFGLDRAFLRAEYEKALAAETTPDCRGVDCLECGVCERLGTEMDLKGSWR